MALTTEEAAVNTAVASLITAIEALYAAKSAGETIHWVPANVGDSAIGNNARSNNDTAVTTDFTTRFVEEVAADGEFTIQIPAGPDGQLVPLAWFVTNAANDLS